MQQPAYIRCPYIPGNEKQHFLPWQFPQTRCCRYRAVTEHINPHALLLQDNSTSVLWQSPKANKRHLGTPGPTCLHQSSPSSSFNWEHSSASRGRRRRKWLQGAVCPHSPMSCPLHTADKPQPWDSCFQHRPTEQPRAWQRKGLGKTWGRAQALERRLH